MALLNCLLAAWYGLPFVSPNNYMVTAINGTGVVIESVYVLIFLVFAAKKEKGRTMALLFGILANDLSAAITLYESSSNPTITLNNLNSLLYICSEALSNSNTRQSAIDFGFKLFCNHSNENLKPNEATLTAVARLAAANGDGDYAFDLAQSVMKQCAAPKLRTFTPALNCFCGAGAADRAYEVEEHVVLAGPQMERALPAMNTIEREHQPNFKEFKEWLEQHSEYETLVDGANIRLYQQNFAHCGFSITQLDAVVKEVHRKTQQQPLVVLHRKRVLSLLENADEQAGNWSWKEGEIKEARSALLEKGKIPNGFGCFLGAMQLILYCIYRKNNEDVKKATIDGSLEMGLANPQQPKNIQS
ncbi:hypothetical protein SASPL_104144 [Salvia splendens]|uniref:PROP1-like PPR domain-containing protein n=1 Tax=Salvia splendens TaxID=180675 RepID=A0A8X8YJD3_SALSN|nr:hypothetical protein SASPL_104144 [Salvia splendens]